MRKRLLKVFRVLVSLLFLTATGILFLDFTGALSPGFINGVTWIQFVPSLVSYLHLPGFLALGFLVVLAGTLMFGRVYCSTVCPLGIMQDVISACSRFYHKRIRRRPKPYRFSAPYNWLRHTLLALTVVTFLSGSIFLLNLLDPFSLFGKIFAGLIRPVYFSLHNLAADVLHLFGNYSLYHVETRQATLWPLLFPALMLGLIAVLSFLRGRLYCNTVCPVGTLLGLLSRFALFRITIEESLCTRCAQCSLNCKGECIDLKNSRVDATRCVGCFNCLNLCSQQGIDYQNHWFPPRTKGAPTPRHAVPGKARPDTPPPQPGTAERTTSGSERRKFLFQLTAYCFGFAAASRIVRAQPPAPDDIREDLGVKATKPSTIPEAKRCPVSPPGSLGLDHFTSRCTACQLCVTACPTKVLQPSFLEYGFTGMMQPRMDFHASFCNYDCIRCTEVCPTGAILPLSREQKHLVQTGIVRLELKNCVVPTEKTACGACAEHCPTQAVHMVDYKEGLTIPEIIPDQCIGCGACEYICPTRPYRAIYVDGSPVHGKAVLPPVEKLEYEPDDDFPF